MKMLPFVCISLDDEAFKVTWLDLKTIRLYFSGSFSDLLRLLHLWSCPRLHTLRIRLSPSVLCSYPTPHPLCSELFRCFSRCADQGARPPWTGADLPTRRLRPLLSVAVFPVFCRSSHGDSSAISDSWSHIVTVVALTVAALILKKEQSNNTEVRQLLWPSVWHLSWFFLFCFLLFHGLFATAAPKCITEWQGCRVTSEERPAR